MIIGQIVGGLGNQMFQYAFYRYLVLIKDSKLKLDLSLFNSYNLHNGYELENIFDIKEEIAVIKEIEQLKSKYSLLFKIENKLLKKNYIFGNKHYKENNFYIDQRIFDEFDKNLYVEGYFQTYKYIQELNLDLFQFQTSLTEIEKKLLEGNVVSIHVRGGDYINNRKDNILFGGICTLRYYENAIKYMKKHLKNPAFLVFTNDQEYAIQLLKNESFKIVNWNTGKNSFRDMYLMSLCKHNIIANSSFSWWGAWLNKNESKIVISPNKWFNNNYINQEQIVPKSWIRVDS